RRPVPRPGGGPPPPARPPPRRPPARARTPLRRPPRRRRSGGVRRVRGADGRAWHRSRRRLRRGRPPPPPRHAPRRGPDGRPPPRHPRRSPPRRRRRSHLSKGKIEKGKVKKDGRSLSHFSLFTSHFSLSVFLALDVGNSETKAGLHDGAGWVRTARTATDAGGAAAWLRALARDARVDAAGLASVVPARTAAWAAAVREAFWVEAEIVHAAMPLPFRLAY